MPVLQSEASPTSGVDTGVKSPHRRQIDSVRRVFIRSYYCLHVCVRVRSVHRRRNPLRRSDSPVIRVTIEGL